MSQRHTALVSALELFIGFCDDLESFVEGEWQRAPDGVSRVRVLKPLLLHLLYVAHIGDVRLIGGRPRPPLALTTAVSRECADLGLTHVQPVVAISGAAEFSTLHTNVEKWLYEPIGGWSGGGGSEHALLVVPRLEGSAAAWRPIVLGHELGHLAFEQFRGAKAFDLNSRFDFTKASTVTVPASASSNQVLWLFEIAQKWTTELVCDANTIRRFGPGGAAALAEALVGLGALDESSETHPHSRLRISLLEGWTRGRLIPRLTRVTDPLRELLSETPGHLPDWAAFLTGLFQDNAEDLYRVAESWPQNSYDAEERGEVIDSVASLFELGIPGSEVVDTTSGFRAVEPPDVINAAWASLVEEQATPTDRLALKALDDLEFLRTWGEAGGEQLDPTAAVDPVTGGPALLTAARITSRIAQTDERRLVVTPLLPNFAKDAALDVRLGNRFIVFERRRITHLDPLDEEGDPRSIQGFVELAWGEPFVLHPHELVLASTLEYFILPGDLSAQVITRSSYGRLGLLSATAVLIHPLFRGCLTLEMVNLSNLPLELTPGERIAQIAFYPAEPPTSHAVPKYDCPTGPQFSAVRSDSEAETLRKLGKR